MSTSNTRPRLLFVEPDDSVRRTVTRVLGRTFEVTPLATAASAIGRVREERFSVAIVDVAVAMMPVIALVRALRETTSDLPIVLTAAAPSSEGEKAAREHDAVAFVAKPYETSVLRTTIDRVLSCPSRSAG